MPKARALIYSLIFPLLLLFSNGCSTLPISGKLPDNLVSEKISSIDEASSFAISPDGNVVAYGDAGLKLLHLPSRERLEITTKRAEQLAWSPFGSSLAAVFYQEGKSAVIIYDQHGIQIAAAVFDGRISSLDWLSENELIAAGLSITNYKFGSNYKSIIHRWQPGIADPVTSPLRDSTLQVATMANQRTFLERGPMMTVHRSGVQILYVHPSDPPLFTPYYKLVLRDLATGREMEIATLGLNSDGGRFSADGEKVVYSDGKSQTIFFNPWSEEISGSVKTPGKSLEVAPIGDYWFADGVLFHGNALVAPLAPGGVGKFSPNGMELFIASKGDLYRLTGLHPPASAPFIADPAKVLQLRSWKMEGLINAKEYHESLKKAGQP